MDLLTVDQQGCNQDGLCAAVCPVGIIDFHKGSFPVEKEDAKELCIRCGHCLCVCPTGSLQHSEMGVTACPPIQQELFFSEAQSEQFFKARRSIRNYRQKSVDKETLENLFDIARYAPSGHNSQGVSWLVIAEKEELRLLGSIVVEWMRYMLKTMPEFALGMHMNRTVDRWQQGEDVILRGAPAVVVAHMEKDNRMAPASCTIALTYLELAAAGMGLGCCWAGYFNAAAATFPPMQTALALPEGYQSFGAMMVGYPKFQYQRIPQRRSPQITWRL